jgi:hypothetical protein
MWMKATFSGADEAAPAAGDCACDKGEAENVRHASARLAARFLYMVFLYMAPGMVEKGQRKRPPGRDLSSLDCN